jgi:hypothetical protein
MTSEQLWRSLLHAGWHGDTLDVFQLLSKVSRVWAELCKRGELLRNMGAVSSLRLSGPGQVRQKQQTHTHAGISITGGSAGAAAAAGGAAAYHVVPPM